MKDLVRLTSEIGACELPESLRVHPTGIGRGCIPPVYPLPIVFVSVASKRLKHAEGKVTNARQAKRV
jgi:hypothetical protein